MAAGGEDQERPQQQNQETAQTVNSEGKKSCRRRLRSESTKRTRSSNKSATLSSSSSSSSLSSASTSSDGEEGGGGGAAPHVRSVACASHGSVSVVGRRRGMEDAVAVLPGVTSAYDFFGVYDGHGGAEVAEKCRERLHEVLGDVAGGDWSGVRRAERWGEVMGECFARVDEEVGEMAGKYEKEKTVGSTAVVAVVGAEEIVVANCGDSRAVLSRGGVAVPLSSDHKPDRSDELERVEAAGGRVIDWGGYRVLGVLATSRSIGDYYLKPYVISEPEVTVTSRTEKDEFLILASDGLWDVLSNEEACKITRQCLSGRAAKIFPQLISGSSASEAAMFLTELAMSRGSTDNISVIVVDLRKSK